MMHPITKMVKDVQNLPHEIKLIANSRSKNIRYPIIIDPLPGSMDKNILKKICSFSKKLKITIDDSEKNDGGKRALLYPKNVDAKNQLMEKLSNIVYEDSKLSIEDYSTID
jgi:hypothetical protein